MKMYITYKKWESENENLKNIGDKDLKKVRK